MLVIPAIEIETHRCVRTIPESSEPDDSVYPKDPAGMALLWRKENAKTLHVTDYDGLYGGRMDNVDEILSIVKSVEIPINLLARCGSIEECIEWFEGGVYRLVVHDLLIEDPKGVRRLVEKYGSSRMVV